MKIHPNFSTVISVARQRLIDFGKWVHGDQWQSVDVADKPEMVMRETLNFSFQVPVILDLLEPLRLDIKPNLPWADDHFEERVGGYPLNPGDQWANWPWGNSADTFRNLSGQFSHTYMERIWPVYAGQTQNGNYSDQYRDEALTPHQGIRYRYGDLNDLVHHLQLHPLSRQAYLPIWFPEDTGVHHRERVPCSIGYHFIMREGYLHTVYQIRSCDVVRHFQDDIYLAVRLKLWVLESLRKLDPRWIDIKPGLFTMHITSLHCFKNDYVKHVKEGVWV